MVLATPGIFRPSALLTAHLTHLTGTPWPLKHRAPVRFHAGTAEIQGKVLLLEGEQMAAGTEGFVQILLEHPTVVVPGDHFILRHQTPLITLGGGVVLDTVPAKRKRMKEEVLGELRERLACLGRPGTAGQASSGTAALVGHILTQADTPRTVNDLCAEVGLLPQQVLDVVRSLAASQRAVAVRLDAVFTAPARLEQLLAAVRECVQGFFTEHPALRAVERPQVRALVERKLGRRQAEFCDDLVSVLKQRGQLQVESNLVSLAGREVRLEGALAAQAQQVEAALATGGLAPPSPADIATRLRIAPKTMREIVKYLVDSQKVVEATPEIVFHQAPFQRAQEALRALFAAKHTLTVSEIRQHLGMNRKYAVPLVELLDRRGFTVRSGDGRTLKG
jgi:selenocysteine-specific elongation factor